MEWYALSLNSTTSKILDQYESYYERRLWFKDGVYETDKNIFYTMAG